MSTFVSPIRPRSMLHRLALIAWVLIVVVSIGLFLVDLFYDYYELLIPCNGVPGVFNDCNFAALTPAEVSVWTSWGFSLQTYAVIILIGTLFILLVYVALAALILWRQGPSWLGLTISLALLLIPPSMFAGSRNFAAINPNLDGLANAAWSVGNVSLLLFVYLMPNGRFSPRWAYIPMIGTLFLLFFGLGAQGGRIPTTGIIATLINSATVALVLFGGSLQIYRYMREANAVERQQTKWVIFAVFIFVTGVIAWVLVFGRALPVADGQPRIIANLVGFVYNLFAFLFLPSAITMAILRYNLWGIDVFVRKTLQYGVVTAVLALVYFGTIILLQGLVGQATGEQSPIIIVFSTLLIAAIFNPLRQRVQTAVDRRFYRQKYDAQQVLAQFSETVRDEVEMSTLQAELLRVVQETLQPQQVGLWIVSEEKRQNFTVS